MNNWKIGTRIVAGFGVVILIAVALGLFAFSRVGVIEKTSNHISANVLPTIYLLGQVQSKGQSRRTLLFQYINSTNKSEKESIERELQISSESSSKMLADYEKLLTNEKEKEFYAQTNLARETYNGVRTEVLRVSRQATPESNKQAQEILNSKGNALFQKYQDAETNWVAFAKSSADEAAAEQQAAVSSTRSGILLVLCVAIVIAVSIAFFIVRSITRPLANAVEVVHQVAQGELPDEVNVSSLDELGQMLTALNRMTGNLKIAANVAVRISEGDLTVEATALSEKDVLGQAQKKMLENLRRTVLKVSST